MKGIEVVGPLPAAMQLVTIFSAGTRAGAANAPAGRALTRFITSRDSAQTLRRHGLEPVEA